MPATPKQIMDFSETCTSIVDGFLLSTTPTGAQLEKACTDENFQMKLLALLDDYFEVVPFDI